MNRRKFFRLALGPIVPAAFAGTMASARSAKEYYEGSVTIDGHVSGVTAGILQKNGRTRQFSGLLWYGPGQNGLSGRWTRNRDRLIFWSFLTPEDEVRFEGKRARFVVEGTVSLWHRGERHSTGTFRMTRIAIPPPPPD